ncbi:MAG: PHP domain-containing protein [Gemmatimonadaceae bacterium]
MHSAARPAAAADYERVGVVHVHSDYSRDCDDSLEQIHAVAAARGISFVALADHAEDFEPELFDEYVAHCARLSNDRVALVPGLEFRFARHVGLHLLALGLSRWMRPATPDAFCSEAVDAATLTVLAHPTLTGYRVPASVTASVGGVEIWNARYNSPLAPDPRAMRMLHDLRVTRHAVAIAGLDQHEVATDGGIRVLVDRTASDPIAELAAGRFVNVGRTMRIGSDGAVTRGRLGTVHAARWTIDHLRETRHWVVRAGRRAVHRLASSRPSSRS